MKDVKATTSREKKYISIGYGDVYKPKSNQNSRINLIVVMLDPLIS